MNKVTLIMLGSLLASTAVAEEVNKTLDADPNGQVNIYNMSGSVEVIAWDRDKVEVTGTVGDDADEFVFERSGKTTTIKVKVPDRRWGRKDVSSELSIRVPKGSSIDISTVSADIDVEGVEGEQDLGGVSGDIVTEMFASDIDANTVSGDVEIAGNGSNAEADLNTVSGDITATGLSGEITAEVVSGDIDIEGGSFSRTKIESVNGDIEFAAGLAENGKLDVETVNGSVDIEFVGSVSADFDVETFNGRIRNCFGPDAERASRYAPGWELSFTEGDGHGRVTIATLNGDVDICKE